MFPLLFLVWLPLAWLTLTGTPQIVIARMDGGCKSLRKFVDEACRNPLGYYVKLVW
ncbi:hypothetical protein K449DRAFT_389528 [Hypoxylon sp. EC38]|nr:hypothetical protein K449DRAFT_389528 [Hypoxylon sp. EC38]